MPGQATVQICPKWDGHCTREAVKNRKSFEAYKKFLSGQVRKVYSYKINKANVVILKADILPSQRLNEKPYTPLVAIDKCTTNIICHHCTCMARFREPCSHAAFLLFKVEAVRVGYTKIECIDVACK